MRYFILLVCLLMLVTPAEAIVKKPAPQPAAVVSLEFPKTPDAVVAELFTSQGCSSCPPAEAYLGDLAKRPDVLTLEFHVDYWDQTQSWLGGAWKDPFSDAAWTKRQVDYNTRLMSEDRAFTPEIVIDGANQEVGSRADAIDALIAQAASLHRRHYKISATITPDGNLTAEADGPGIRKPVQVVLLRLLKTATTEIKGGENKGRQAESRNIVRSLLTLGTWSGGKQSYKFNLPSFKPEESCALLLQDPETMHILAGGQCHL